MIKSGPSDFFGIANNRTDSYFFHLNWKAPNAIDKTHLDSVSGLFTRVGSVFQSQQNEFIIALSVYDSYVKMLQVN